MEQKKTTICNHARLRSAGFTLVEMLVATSLFSVIILTATDIFIRVQRAERQAAVLEKTQDIVRFFLTRISQEVQSGSIDYDYYGSSLQNDPYTKKDVTQIFSQTLALRTSQGERIQFTSPPQNTDYNSICNSTDVRVVLFPCLVIAKTYPNTQAERMNPPGFTITKLMFYITPSSDPFTVGATNDFQSNAQPKVTIMLSVRSTVPGIKAPYDLSVQTTVSTREYRR